MNNKLSQEQIDNIKNSLLSGYTSTETEIKKLVSAGFDEEVAKKIISDVMKSLREELFEQSLLKKKKEEARSVAILVITMVSLIGPIFNMRSIGWYMLAVAIVAAVAYYGFKDKPIAGIIGSITVVILFPIMYNYYFASRSSYIRIELLIPLVMAAIPALLIFLLLSKLIYPKH